MSCTVLLLLSEPRSVILVAASNFFCSPLRPPPLPRIQSNFGCNHDKGTKNACSTSSYNYGYRDPQARFRSILSYNCKSGQCDNISGGSCARVQRFSNTYALYNGRAIGKSDTDNARRINAYRNTVANYYDSPTVSCCYAIESILMFAHLYMSSLTLSYPFVSSSTATSSYASTHKSSNTSPEPPADTRAYRTSRTNDTTDASSHERSDSITDPPAH